jgi:hypothetical protein
MNRLVRGALGISVALALGAVAQAQVRRPTPPAAPPARPPPSVHLTTPSLTSPSLTGPSLPSRYLTDPAPGTAITSPNATTSTPATTSEPAASTTTAAEVRPPRPGREAAQDGGGECDEWDGNALNDPNRCIENEFTNVSAANVSPRPAEPGWRPSWWMIVLGVIAVLILYGWIRDAVRRR